VLKQDHSSERITVITLVLGLVLRQSAQSGRYRPSECFFLRGQRSSGHYSANACHQAIFTVSNAVIVSSIGLVTGAANSEYMSLRSCSLRLVQRSAVRCTTRLPRHCAYATQVHPHHLVTKPSAIGQPTPKSHPHLGETLCASYALALSLTR
jgi:hypothetical protein